MAYLLAALMAASFLPQGLFYRHEFLPAEILLSLWLLAWGLRCCGRVGWTAVLGPLLIVLGYALSLLDAIRPADALMSVTQVLLLGGLLIASGSLTPRGRAALLGGMALGALLSAGLGLLVRAGFWNYPAAYTPPMLAGPLEYHNSFAALMGLGLLALFLLAAVLQQRRLSPVFSALGTLLATSLLLSLSRGVYVLYPLFALLLIAALRGPERRAAVAAAVGSALPAVVLLRPISGAADGHSPVFFLWLLLAMAVGAAVAGLIERLPERGTAQTGPRGARLWPAGVLAVLILGYLGRHRLASGLRDLLGSSVSTRVQAISTHSVSLQMRLWMDGISGRIIADHPVLGYGGGAWPDLYHADQWIWFIANETHNYFTQVWIEGGVIAEAGLLLLLFLLLRRIWSALFGRDPEPPSAGAATIALFLLAHAAMDFDFSYFSLAACFFVLTGMGISQPEPEKETMRRSARPALRAFVLPLAGIGLLLSAPLAAGENLYQQGQQALQAGHFARAKTRLDSAARFDPQDGRIALSEALLAQNSSPALALRDLKTALRLLGTDGGAQAKAMQIAQQDGAWSFGAEVARQALRSEPLRADTYWYGGPILAEAAVQSLSAGRKVSAGQDIAALRELVRQGERLPESALYVNVQYVPLPQYLPAVLAASKGEELALSGHLAAALPLLWQAHGDPALRPTTDIWLYAVAERVHSSNYIARVATQPWVLWRSVNPLFTQLQKGLPRGLGS